MAASRFTFIWLILPVSVFAQTNRYFVSFKDKANSIYSVSNPLQFLSQKSIDRRARENFTVTEEDFPVNANYVGQVKATGAEVYFTSRWFNGVLVQTNPSIVSAINTLPFVKKVELVAPDALLTGGRKASSQKVEQVNQTTTLVNQFQLEMIGLDQMHAAGYHGEGIDIALFDDGFRSVDTISGFKPLFQEGRIKATFSFVYNNNNIYRDDTHGTSTLSILAGNIPGQYLGGAYKANFFLYQTEDYYSEYRVEEYNWLFAAERADSAGVDVISSSLGYFQFFDSSMDYTYNSLDGKTTVISQAAHAAYLRGISVVNAAGNEGGTSWKYVIAPADAVGVIAVGAVDSQSHKTNFSSVGPSADGRIKPDVSALGASNSVFGNRGCCYVGSGTSFACPLVAGLVAGLRQAFPNASAAEIYSRLVNSASQANKPDNLLGYGIPNFETARTLTDFNTEFEVYPNPTSNLLKIIFKNADGRDVKATLYNSAGQKVFEMVRTITWANNPFEIDFSNLATGLFLLRIETNTGSISKRIVKVD